MKYDRIDFLCNIFPGPDTNGKRDFNGLKDVEATPEPWGIDLVLGTKIVTVPWNQVRVAIRKGYPDVKAAGKASNG